LLVVLAGGRGAVEAVAAVFGGSEQTVVVVVSDGHVDAQVRTGGPGRDIASGEVVACDRGRLLVEHGGAVAARAAAAVVAPGLALLPLLPAGHAARAGRATGRADRCV
jgi:hypothetical protein